jgi:hypothetical protein
MSWGRKFSASVVKAAMMNSVSIGRYTCSTAEGQYHNIQQRVRGARYSLTQWLTEECTGAVWTSW